MVTLLPRIRESLRAKVGKFRQSRNSWLEKTISARKSNKCFSENGDKSMYSGDIKNRNRLPHSKKVGDTNLSTLGITPRFTPNGEWLFSKSNSVI